MQNNIGGDGFLHVIIYIRLWCWKWLYSTTKRRKYIEVIPMVNKIHISYNANWHHFFLSS